MCEVRHAKVGEEFTGSLLHFEALVATTPEPGMLQSTLIMSGEDVIIQEGFAKQVEAIYCAHFDPMKPGAIEVPEDPEAWEKLDVREGDVVKLPAGTVLRAKLKGATV